MSREDGMRNRSVVGRLAPLQRLGRALREADIRRMQIKRVHCPVAALGYFRVSRRRELVESIRPVHDPRPLRTELRQRSGNEFSELRPRNADELPGGAGRIREWSEQIECGPHPKLL